MFKAGDTVRIIAGVSNGTSGVVTRKWVSSIPQRYDVRLPSGVVYGFRETSLELIESPKPTLMPKFAVGTKVRRPGYTTEEFTVVEPCVSYILADCHGMRVTASEKQLVGNEHFQRPDEYVEG